ncbi:MAG: ABC transporter substrate-binding protein [Betaproteobacteria bacterium]|nr:MAG: ABC transporter substrate-binding protein [Betaproteobacteria bacterium]
MSKHTFRGIAAACAVAALSATAPSANAQNLNLLCNATIDWCELMKNKFEAETGIKTSMTRRSSGEAYAQIRAESANPKVDVWWAGTGDPHLQAASEGLTEVYQSPQLAKLQPWARKVATASGNRTVGIYLGALGYAYNDKLLASKKLPAPKCWSDLADPKYKDEVQMPDPNSSGTAYTMLATLVQLMGEDKAFDYMKRLHKNVNQYTKSGVAPSQAVGRGETLVGISFMHDLMIGKVGGFPVTIVTPCEGTGYEIGSMSIIKGARNMTEAKRFYEFALRPDIQSMSPSAKAYQIPSHTEAKVPAESIKPADVKLIDYDQAKYGSTEVRRALLKRWGDEVSSAPK